MRGGLLWRPQSGFPVPPPRKPVKRRGRNRRGRLLWRTKKSPLRSLKKADWKKWGDKKSACFFANHKKSKKIAYFSSCKGRNAYISSFPFLPAENQADYLLLVSAQAAFLEGAWGKSFFGQQRMVSPRLIIISYLNSRQIVRSSRAPGARRRAPSRSSRCRLG